MSDRFDHELSCSLMKGTERSGAMQDEVWRRIRQQLEQESTPTVKADGGMRQGALQHRRQRWWAPAVAVAALLWAGGFFAFVPTGQALVDQVRAWFAPEKTVVVELEGMSESATVELQEGPGYVIYFDENMYRMVYGEAADRIVPAQELGEMYPEVYMEIRSVSEAPEDVVQSIYNIIRNEPTVLAPRQVDDPVSAWELYAVGGTGGLAWDDPVVRYYVFSDGGEGSYVVQQQYFLEAEEGHGERFKMMLKEFYLLEERN